ncbi:Apolipoprotein D [Amphibalanus amphitrite]|uniref:Apolipoprotein D n=1 Tax=Amphibalanus amphitrite TaxID=1232801 RepID=A0A6A4VE07_AMPAM|nr:Apolipoprotein D [Amphibalanus amphitrite]
MSPPRVAVPLALLLTLAALTAAQQRFPGSCPRPPIVQKFQVRRYLGHWFEYARYVTVFQRGLRCSRAEYSDAREGRIGVVNRAIRIADGSTTEARGQAVPVGRPGEASLRVSFDGQPSRGTEANYNVLETDYKRYAIVWSCTSRGVGEQKNLENEQLLFVLTRARVPSQRLLRRIMRRLQRLGLNTEKLIKTDQENCSKLDKIIAGKSRKAAILKLCSLKHH